MQCLARVPIRLNNMSLIRANVVHNVLMQTKFFAKMQLTIQRACAIKKLTQWESVMLKMVFAQTL